MYVQVRFVLLIRSCLLPLLMVLFVLCHFALFSSLPRLLHNSTTFGPLRRCADDLGTDHPRRAATSPHVHCATPSTKVPRHQSPPPSVAQYPVFPYPLDGNTTASMAYVALTSSHLS